MITTVRSVVLARCKCNSMEAELQTEQMSSTMSEKAAESAIKECLEARMLNEY